MPAGGLAWAAETVAGRPTSLTWTAALLAWVAAVPMFKAGQYVSTVAHEGGHALLAKLLFRRLTSISFDRHGGGLVKPAEKMPLPFTVVFLFAGYVGPSMFGLLAAWLLLHGHTDTVLWGSLAFLTVMLLAVRGLVGWILVPVLFVGILLVATRVEDPALRSLAAHVWAWFLLIAPVQDMFWFMRARLYAAKEGNDAASLRQATGISSELWSVLFLLGTLAALLYGGALLLRLDPPI